MSEQKCEEARATGHKKVNSYYDPRINEIAKINALIKKSGDNPHKHAIDVNGTLIRYDDLESKLRRDKVLASKEVDRLSDNCNKKLQPYQDIIDKIVEIGTGGLSKVLPKGMTHVDVSDILSGYPLGGPNSIFNKTRDDLLKKLGIGGDVATVIKDPAKPVRDILDKLRF